MLTAWRCAGSMFSTIRQSMQLFGSFQDTQMLALGDEGEEFDLQVGQDAARGVAGACRAARERSGDAARWRSVCVKKWRLARPGRASPCGTRCPAGSRRPASGRQQRGWDCASARQHGAGHRGLAPARAACLKVWRPS